MAKTIEQFEDLRRYSTEEYLMAGLLSIFGSKNRMQITNLECLYIYGFTFNPDQCVYEHKNGLKFSDILVHEENITMIIHERMKEKEMENER